MDAAIKLKTAFDGVVERHQIMDYVTPKAISELVAKIGNHPIDKERRLAFFICSGHYTDFVTDIAMLPYFDPVSKVAQVKQGYIGVVLGVNVYTDVYFLPEEQFLKGSYVVLLDKVLEIQ